MITDRLTLCVLLAVLAAQPAAASVIRETDASIVVSGGATAFTMWHVDGSHPCAVVVTTSADRVELGRTSRGGGDDDGPLAQSPALALPSDLPYLVPPGLDAPLPSALAPPSVAVLSPVPLPGSLPLAASALLALGLLGALTRVGALTSDES